MSDRIPFAKMTEEQRQKVAQALWSRENPRCQSSLVDELVKEQRDGFTLEDITNLYPDPSDWGIEKCREWLRDNGHDCPDVDPWKMTREDLAEALTDVGIECRDDEDRATLLEAYVANIDDETIDGIKDWRDTVRDNAEAAEVYEWWEVGDWLAERLENAGEVVLRNGYGDWWGRCCTGQSVTLDRVIQELGAEYCQWAIQKGE